MEIHRITIVVSGSVLRRSVVGLSVNVNDLSVSAKISIGHHLLPRRPGPRLFMTGALQGSLQARSSARRRRENGDVRISGCQVAWVV
jgi:hypothetical protein